MVEATSNYKTCTSNSDFKQAALSHPFISLLLSLTADSYQSEAPSDPELALQLGLKLLEQINQATLDYQCLDPKALIDFLFGFYLRENCLGPSVYTEYVEDTRAPLVKGELPVTEFDPISTKNKNLQGALLNHFQRDGETLYVRSQMLVCLYCIETLLEDLRKKEMDADQKEFVTLYQARLSFLLDRHLSSSVLHLKDASLDHYKELVSITRSKLDSKPDDAELRMKLSMLLIEQSYCQFHFYKYEKAESSVNEAMKLQNLDMELTGKLGRRTKFQVFDCAHLTLDFKNREVNLQIDQSSLNDLLPTGTALSTDVSGVFKPDHETEHRLESESILFKNGPKFIEQVFEKVLSDTDLVLLNAYTHSLFKTLPKEETREELLRPFTLALTKDDKVTNWLIKSSGLLHRSRNEFERFKTKEKSLIYLQGLIDQFRNQGIDLDTKLKYYFQLCFPMKWELHLELGELYKGIGSFVSAFELLNEVELTEEAIKCLFMAGRQTQALKLAEQHLGETLSTEAKTDKKAKKKSITQANLLCLLGDIKRDAKYYEQAWEESGQKCARAMRSLGRMRFFENKFEEAIVCFNKAFEINRLYPKEWFTCGCAHMRLEQLDKAIFAFGNVVSIDETQTDAWANIANCYAVQNKFAEALACTEQALKEKRSDWRIWHNCIKFSIACGQFYRAIFAVNELLRTNQLEGLNGQLLMKISELFIEKYVNKQDITADEFIKHKQHLYKFYIDFSNKINDFRVWRLICRIKQVLQEPHPTIIEVKKNEIRSLQKPGWNVELAVVENVERAIIELVELLDKEISNEEKAFIRTTAIAIEHALQRKCKMQDLVQRMSD